MKERRKYKRFPTLSVLKSIELSAPSLKMKESIPAIMFNLSGGGIAFITFCPFPLNSNILFNLDLGDIKLKNIKGKVVRMEEKKQTYLVGVQFLNLPQRDKKKIIKMADDYESCESRILHHENIICFPSSCSYYNLCNKKQKISLKQEFALNAN